MVFIPFADGIEVVYEFRIDGQTVKNVLNFVSTTTPTLTILTNLGKALIDAFMSSDWASDVVGDDLSFEDIKLTSMVSDSAPSTIVTESGTFTLPQSPGSGGLCVPNNVALVVTERTDNRGRSFRGRTYLPGIRRASLDSTVEVPALVATDALQLLVDIQSAGVAQDCALSIFSRIGDGVERTTGLATPVTSFACNTALDSQRRRLEGRGS